MTVGRRAICLWDFSWYVRTAPGDCFDDLDRACAETVERGFTTVRICAMPFLLFGSGLDTSALRLGPLPNGVGQGTRWYDVPAETTIDARAHLLALFEACRRHGLDVIVSSWEYQQSPSFALDSAWYDALHAIDPNERPVRLAEACAALLDFLDDHGLADLVLFTELHNEVATGYLSAGLEPGTDLVVALKDRLTRGIDRFHELQPGRLCTVNYSRVPVGSMRGIPDNADVLVCHPYLYGVLDELIAGLGLRARPFDPAALMASGLLRADAPPWAEHQVHGWRAEASIVCPGEMYAHDFVDERAWDAWLTEHYPPHEIAMRDRLDTWLAAAADHALAHDIPLVFGEGWVGYTPLRGRFEEDAIGLGLIHHAMTRSAEIGAWGSIVCSNAAPHHPMWADREQIVQANRLFLDSPATTPVIGLTDSGHVRRHTDHSGHEDR